MLRKKLMTVSDYLAILAVLLSSAALSLELRRWVESRPRLALTVIADAIELPGLNERPKMALFVTNRGNAQTLVTDFVAYSYRNQWQRLLGKPVWAAVVNPHANAALSQLPVMLGPNERWNSTLIYDDRSTKARQRGELYVGVFASHLRRPSLIHVPPPRTSKGHPSRLFADASRGE